MVLECIEVTLKSVYMEQANEFLGKARLRSFQKEIADIQDGAIVLTAPTGSGKTVTLLTDVSRMVSVGFYPNNELLLSQIAGLHNFITSYLGMKSIESPLLDYAIKPEEMMNTSYAPYNLYSGDCVEIFGRRVKRLWILGLSGRIIKRFGEGGKLDTLKETVERLVRLEDAYGVVVATPDTYFLLSLYAYRDFCAVSRLISTILSMPPNVDVKYIEDVLRMGGLAPREKLTEIISVFIPIKNATIFIDEYHLYDLYDVYSFKVLLYLLKEVHAWDGRLIFSSATPNIKLAKIIADEADLQLKELNAIERVREKGDMDALVRGEIELTFFGVDTERKSRIGKAYGASEKAIDLLRERKFEKFIESYKGGIGRGMIILEKVSHADVFAEGLYRIYGVKPVCLFSTAPSTFPTMVSESARDEGGLLIVGTGARIGQGVEFRNITFGIVARAIAYDYLQSLSRIGRRYPGRSTILTPVDISQMDKLGKEIDTMMTYGDLVRWIEETKVFLRSKVEEPSVYKNFVSIREYLLKLLGISLFYRHTGTWTDEIRKVSDIARNLELRVLSPPDEIYGITMFRSTGPEVKFYRDKDDGVERSDNLGTIIRNYVVDIDANGKLVLVKSGRSELLVKCGERGLNMLKRMGQNRLKPVLVSWSFLQDVLKCEIIDSHKLDTTGFEGQLFMVVDTNDSEIAEFLAATGRGLRVDTGMEKKTLVLIFV
ncbi:MAG: hypothetical protein QXF84_05350 [Nitrososphaerota archaeon]